MVAISAMSPLKNQENRRKMVAAEAKLLYDQIQKTTITPGTNWYLYA
jgi:hypothetical protein